ncbi:MAG: PLP-dependent cysteine synthase family protein [Hyphomonas sp.]|nr:PLP-dependent cysteine synthase family protein [Hyphomonas sp.]
MGYSALAEQDVTRERRLAGLDGMVGHTPLLAVHVRWKGERRTVFAKAEHFNLTGSIKDRMALNILRCGYECGALKEGDLIVEATSGNAGISMAAIGRALGHRVRIYMPDWMSDERKSLLRSLGAELCLVTREEGGFLGAIAATEALSESREDVFLPRQFSNCDNCNAHMTSTGPEIVRQLAQMGEVPDAFVAGVGTGGTIMGVGRALRKTNQDIRLHALEPAESPTLSTGYKTGQHRIQGVSDDFIPAIVKLDELDEIVSAHDGDSIIMAQKLAADLGLGVGISSGANMIGALKVQEQLGGGAVVATVFADDNKKYLSTDLSRKEAVRPGFIAPEVELLGYDCISDRIGLPTLAAVA